MTTKITEKNISNIANTAVQWQTVHVADGSTALTTSAGKGYFIDTTSGAQTVNLPSVDDSTLGDTIMLKDFARQWGTNAVTMGSNTFDGVTAQTPSFSTDGQTVTLVFMGSTRGWSLINEDTTTGLGALFIEATGGTVTTSGNFKIHTFTGDGCFVVSSTGNPAGSTTADYLVVAGGGGGGWANGGGGGGGAGGLRYSDCTYSTPAPDPSAGTALPISAQTYPITVGAGGAHRSGSPDYQSGNDGSNSVFSTITSAGGGGGGGGNCGGNKSGRNGGSGGGGGKNSSTTCAGSGNTPPVSPPQGNDGGTGGGPSSLNNVGGGGGGAGAAGCNNSPSPLRGGNGGNGLVISINGSCAAYAGGGGGQNESQPGPAQGQGGSGGGGTAGETGADGNAGSANTGGGGGGADSQPNSGVQSGAGGKGVVIIRYKFQTG
jgi:hypothetical protein